MLKTLPLLFVLVMVLLSHPAQGQVKAGDMAPDFGQPDLFGVDGQTGTRWVSDFIGPDAPSDKRVKALLISFCASYCKPCWKELPFLLKLKKDLGSSGLEVWSILVDRDADGLEAGRTKLASAKGTIVLTRTGSRAMADKFMGGKWEMPALFLLDSTGKVVMTLKGLDHGGLDRLEKKVGELLK